MEIVLTPDNLRPEGVAILGSVKDSAGDYFSPESCAITYGRDGSGNITTETATDGSHVWVKTYTWTSGLLTAESKWVKQ